MKTIRKKLSVVFLSVYMVFGVVSTDYLTVQAFEWVVPSLTVGDSLLWLMGLLGMTYTEGASAWRDVSPEYEQEFIDYANEHGMTYNQTSTWLNDVASGKLDQLSEVWTNFKEWLKSLGSVSNVGTSNFIYYCYPSISSISPDDVLNYNVKYAYYTIDSSNTVIYLYLFNDSYTYHLNANGQGFYFSGGTGFYTTSARIDFVGNLNFQFVAGSNASRTDVNTFVYGVDATSLPALSNFHVWDLNQDNPNSAFNTYNPALIPDINFAGANTEDSSIPGVIDLPWGNLGDDEEERDKTYDDLVGGLDLGQEIGDLWQALQDLMGVLAVDDAGVLQPNTGGENPPTLEDEAENNKVNGAFVLTGLQKVFPFCIPFDLYAFITLLEAPPVAPVIEYPIYNPVTKSNEIITIDFSTWESVVVLFRYIFDFLFIIGLLLMARALIGGGDSA